MKKDGRHESKDENLNVYKEIMQQKRKETMNGGRRFIRKKGGK